MNDLFWPGGEQRADLPVELMDDELRKPFERCRVCELDLHQPPVPYMVEKVIRRNPVSQEPEVLFGYAICLDCVEDMKSQISRESLEAIQQFLSGRDHFQQRMEQLYSGAELNPEQLLHECLLSGKSSRESKEYQLAGLCEGKDMIIGMWPYMIDSEVAGELSELLSEETLGNMDDFYGQHFGLPPEWADLFKDKPVFWI